MPISIHRKAILAACILFINFLWVTAIDQDGWDIRNFTKNEYKAESQNWSIAQDDRGFVYVANNAGLLEFDGVDWNFHPAPNGAVIRSVAVDKQNRIYTSGYREIGYWECDEFGELEYSSLNRRAESLFSQNEEFWTTLVSDDHIYFHSFSSIFIYDYKQFKILRPGGLITSISKINENIAVHIKERGIFLIQDTLLVPYITDERIRKNPVLFTAARKDSSILIGTISDGVYLYSDSKLQPWLERWKPYFSQNKINRGAIAENGNIIIGTLLDGIVIFDKNGNFLNHINNEQGLQNNTILGIFINADNNIWLSLDKGIDFIGSKTNHTFKIFPHEGIGAVYAATLHEDNLYVGTNQGVFFRKWQEENQVFQFVPGTQGQAWTFQVVDNLLLVGHNEGCFKIQNGIAEKISDVSGGFSLTPNPLKRNELIQSSYSSIVFLEKVKGSWVSKLKLPGFNNLIRYTEFDHLNNLWASHMYRGVYRIQLNDSQDSIKNLDYYGETVFGKDLKIQVSKIENRLVFATGEYFYTYNDLKDSIVLYDQLNTALGRFRSAHRVIPGPDHHYWLISRSGIALFKIRDNNFIKIKEYPVGLFGDHLITGYENIFPLSSYEGLLCLDNGYAVLKAKHSDNSSQIEDKQLSIRQIEFTGRNDKIEKLPFASTNIKIPFKQNNLTIRYSFPFISNEPIKYQSFVEGLDLTWNLPQDKPIFKFDRIPSGVYKIHVRAMNSWNKKSVSNLVKLVVSPPWYLKNISILIYFLIILLSLLVGRYFLLQRIKSREEKLKQAKEKELIKLRNEKLNAELSFKSQELANSTMSIIKKNEFLMELKELIKKQKEDLGTRFPEKHYLQIVHKIDNNISSMDDWDVFEIHFEKAHEKFLQKLMNKFPVLTHSDLRLCAYLRMNLSSKEIAPLMRISVRGVENHRYKLRKKLNLKKEEDLTDYVLSV